MDVEQAYKAIRDTTLRIHNTPTSEEWTQKVRLILHRLYQRGYSQGYDEGYTYADDMNNS